MKILPYAIERWCALLLASQLGCGSAPAQAPNKPENPPSSTTSTSTSTSASGAGSAAKNPAPPAGDPTTERAAAFREAAEKLERAARALLAGNRNNAEELFTAAELLVGSEALADLAERFREGAPPRVTTTPTKFDPQTAPQPKTIGSSEQEDVEDKVEPPRAAVEASLTGAIQIGGRSAGGVGLVTLDPIGPGNKKGKKRPSRRRVIEQRGREFAPKLTAISVGSTIAFPNFDSLFHNVFSTSPVTPFDLGMYRNGEAREFTFTKEGVIRVGCNLHANMSAYIAVVASPHYTVTDGSGEFSFRHLAPGRYKLSAWNERSKEPVVKEITIKAGKNQLDVGVTDDAPIGPPPDKFGGKRG
jgi:plastocyanin